jgi:hypothetical protein
VLNDYGNLPIYGLGHSMGCKVHLLINSLWQVERAGNIYMSFNNYPCAAIDSVFRAGGAV